MIVIRKRAGTKVDPYSGQPEGSDWDNPSTLPMEAVFAPATPWSREIVTSAGVSLSFDATLYFEGQIGLDIRADDRIEVNGRTYRVNGEPAEWEFEGIIGGSVVALEVVE